MSPGADVVDAAVVVAWGRGGVHALAQARASLDRVNVFPVADADTGTNMYLTLLDAVRALPAGTADTAGSAGGAGDVLVRLARGALVGARGNSGVILSEYLRGLALELAEHRTVSGAALAVGLDRAARTARGAVARPAPGTILTAADAAARAAADVVTDGDPSPGAVAAAARDGARAAALRSTDELDALARAQVLDAGALGLVLVLGALVAALDERTGGSGRTQIDEPGRGLVDARLDEPGAVPGTPAPVVSEVLGMMSGMTPVTGSSPGAASGTEAAHEGGEFEVMYVVDLPGGALRDAAGASTGPGERLRSDLSRIGDSVVVVGGAGEDGSGLWQAHVHTDDPMAAVVAGRAVLADAQGRASREGAGALVALRQVRVRHLPGAHGHGHRAQAGGTTADRAPSDEPGLVAVTSAPGLVADLARAGAVVLLRDEPGAPDLAALHRVAVDARAAHVVVLPGGDLPEQDVATLRAALREDGVESLEVLPAPTDLHVTVALAAAQLVDGPGRVDAVRSALATVRTSRASAAGTDGPEAARRLVGLLESLLERPAEVVTVLADDDVPLPALDALAPAAARSGAELVLLRSGRDGGTVALAVEGAVVHHGTDEAVGA
ncbi:DAK2 domain-containing protein [Cellulosimicrobium sp. XJ-DQ-B-000]|uniref:DAK2 domain-containing protein n=1 Tax=Cellulosimicrobium sp. XJ-DQ-B-000 TaxID=3072182 RepID=UPI002808647E|nr:DAK2 domain-containing protein [Cellulosimicrobium sp. XJ-DQ-B-000]MDQ8041537.1 DAK2 domain-containing protein [Cellulosimicrobium sp. XJ-DQ-B-000]